jgi:hypothetical protein
MRKTAAALLAVSTVLAARVAVAAAAERTILVRVNGALVLDSGDTLFDALGSGSTVTVQVLRHGLPQTFEYRIE